MNRVFFDTNVVVYRFDAENNNKSKVAERILRQHFNNKTGVVSTQVIQEFLNVSLRKFQHIYSPGQAIRIVEELLEPMCRHTPDFLYYKRALELYDQHSLSFYDALIVQAAIDTNCQVLYSEDLQHGQKFGNLTVQNPFL